MCHEIVSCEEESHGRAPSRVTRARRQFFVDNLYVNRKCTGAMVGAHPFGGFNLICRGRIRRAAVRITCCCSCRRSPWPSAWDKLGGRRFRLPSCAVQHENGYRFEKPQPARLAKIAPERILKRTGQSKMKFRPSIAVALSGRKEVDSSCLNAPDRSRRL